MKNGFVLTELLITITIFILILGVVYSGYLLSQRGYREGEKAAEITQNSRVILERIIREVRQAREIISDLEGAKENAISSLEFEDGHIEGRYYYIKYFIENGDVKREVKRYYFPDDPETFVIWNAGEGLEFTVTEESQIIGEFVKDLKFWTSEIGIIDVFITLEKLGKQIDFSTKISGRNL